MRIAECAPVADYEHVVRAHDRESGLMAIVAIHNTRRGPALGGCRMRAYSSDAEAMDDVLRLARGMTYKNALADLPFGGGKSVIIGDPATLKTPALLRAMGRFIHTLSGAYTVAEDVGTTPADMAALRLETPFVAGLEGAGGDPSPATAWGVYCGIRAAVEERLGRGDLKGLRIALQGLGNVGWSIARLLAHDGASLFVCDIDDRKVEAAQRAFGATPVSARRIYEIQSDVFVPCALGAIINDDTIPLLRTRIVAGSANNQLAEERHGLALKKSNILYAPDYAINAGGVINIYHEHKGDYRQRDAFEHIARIYDTLQAIFKRSRRLDIPPSLAADQLAEERFQRKAAA